MKVLLSIKPEFAEKILNGTKRFEFRKGIFKNKEITTVVIYATMPLGKVVGQFHIDCVLSDHPDTLWEQTKKYAGITKDFFDDYYVGRETGYAIKIANAERFECPLPITSLGDGIKPPQSYLYLPG
jgi:Uncharacterized conserved protein